MKTIMLIFSFLLTVGVSTFGRAQDAPLQLALDLMPEAKWSSPHNPKIEITETNISNQVLALSCDRTNKLYVFMADGSRAPLTDEEKQYWYQMEHPLPTTLCVAVEMKPGQAEKYTSDDPGRYYQVDKPGTYTVYDEMEVPGVFVAKSNRVMFVIR